MKITCPLCNSTKNKLVYSMDFRILQCQDCQLYFHEKYYSLDQLKNFYENEHAYKKTGYYASIPSPKKYVFSEQEYKQLFNRNLRKKFVPVIDSFTPPLDILEIGADAGGASTYMKQKGHNVEATEICKEYCARMRQKNIIVHQGLFEDIKFGKYKRYDIIVALEVIEHFSNPVWSINRIYNLLKNDGKFIFQTPIAPEGLVKEAKHTIGLQPAHFCIFNPVSIKILLKEFKTFSILNGIYVAVK
jgi:2-polyprenyl-3-methyl-5-hydroxy-6-metoxy-1,4-benzoquinol methylase